MINLFDPVHPGVFIREMFMEPFEISAADLSEKLHVSPSTLSRVLNGKADLSVEMALRLSRVLGRSAESWINMQTHYSLNASRKSPNVIKELDELVPIFLYIKKRPLYAAFFYLDYQGSTSYRHIKTKKPKGKVVFSKVQQPASF